MAKALPVLKLTEKSFEINAENFKSVLSKVGDRPFAAISINGTTRTGKSYILSHFVRYFESKKRYPTCTNWYDNPSCANFEWQSGLDRTTTGINLWSEPYIVKTRRGEEIAVLLLDTQGLFDQQTSIRQNVIIFSISTLCSSVMIFNVMRLIDENILQELDFFCGYAHLTCVNKSKFNNQDGNGEGKGESIRSINSESSYKHGSDLHFLIRDFELPEQYGYGAHTRSQNPPSKKNLFKDTIFLQQRPYVPEENKTVRENILKSFRDVSIYTLPDPGKAFKTQKGKSIAPDEEFKTNVILFVEYMVEERNLVKKTVLDKPVSGFEFQKYIDSWSRMCEKAGEVFPEVFTVSDNTAFTQYSIAMNLGVSKYKNDMDKYVREKQGSATSKELKAMHSKLKSEAKYIFGKSRKVRHAKFEKRFTNDLATNIEHCYELCKVTNAMLKEVVEKSKKNEEMLKQKLHEMDRHMAVERLKTQAMVRGLNETTENLLSRNKQLSIEMKEKEKEYLRAMDQNQRSMDQVQKTQRELNQRANAMRAKNAQALKHSEMVTMDSLAIHPGVFCDACNCSIRGVRFKCRECPNFDLCQDCMARKFHSHHSFVSLSKTKQEYLELQLGAAIHPGVYCDACDCSIKGVRFKCRECPDFDLCQDCMARKFHSYHSFVSLSKTKQEYLERELEDVTDSLAELLAHSFLIPFLFLEILRSDKSK